MSPYDLLPSWAGLRDNLWAALVLAIPLITAWTHARYKRLSPSLQLAALMAVELILLVPGLTAVSRFGWVAVAPAVVVLFLPALFLYLPQLHDTTSEVSRAVEVTFKYEKDKNLFCTIKNLSDVADFWATLEHIAGRMPGWPRRDVFARWNHQVEYKTQIPRHGEYRLFLGSLRLDRGEGTWTVPFVSETGPGEVPSELSFSSDNPIAQEQSAIAFRLVIFSNPERHGLPLALNLRLIGDSFESSFEKVQ